MKKVVIHSPGGYEKLKIEEAPDLTPGPGEVMVETEAIGINFADVCIRLGIYESAKKYVGWPITPGFEVSGTVAALGKDVGSFQVGQKVVAFTLFNGYATQVCVPVSQVLPVPPQFSLQEAAGFPAVFFTAYHALYQHIILRPHLKVLIHSAAGGVGTALVQLCQEAGFFTVGVVGASHKREYLEKFNLRHIIDKSKENLWEKASQLAPEGYDLIFDANGYSTMGDSYRHLAPTGKLIVYGSHDLLSKKGGRLNYFKAMVGMWRTPRFSPLSLISRNRSVLGFNLSFLFGRKDLMEECIERLGEMIDGGKIRPIPVTPIDFEKVADAHRFIESGQSVGKIVLVP